MTGKRLMAAIALVSGVLVTTARPVLAAESDSYDVICVYRTIPGDPQPYRVCVPYPL